MPNMLLSAEVALGRRAAGTTGSDEASGVLCLTARLQDKGNGQMEIWFEKADLDERSTAHQWPKWHWMRE